MLEQFQQLPGLLQTFWVIALPSSLIFIIQTIMTFVGADATDGIGPDFDGDFGGGDAPFQLFSLRNLINFLLGFGWTGISFYTVIENPAALIAISLVVGIGFVAVFFFLMVQIQKLAENNSFSIEKLVGKTGEVYLKIPGNRQGKGKVQISLNGSVHEIDAITDLSEGLERGRMVRVKSVEDGHLLIVESL